LKIYLTLIVLLGLSNSSFSQEVPFDNREAFSGLDEILIQAMDPNFPLFDLGDLHQDRGCNKRQIVTLERPESGEMERYEILEYREVENMLRIRKIRSGSRETTRTRGYGVEFDLPEQRGVRGRTSISVGVARIQDRLFDGTSRSSTSGLFSLTIER